MDTTPFNRRDLLKLFCYGAAFGSIAPTLTAHAVTDEELALLGGVKWIRQSGFRIENAGQVIYIDPYQVPDSPHDADLVLITHPHNDHCEAASVQRVSKDSTLVVVEGDSAQRLGNGFSNLSVIQLGDERTIGNTLVSTFPAYNTNKTYHPKANEWMGFILTLQDGRTIYHGGDTDFIPEMETLDVDVAILPISGTFTATATEAGQAMKAIRPKLAVPMHWNGSSTESNRFLQEIGDEVPALVMEFGQSIPLPETSVKDWGRS